MPTTPAPHHVRTEPGILYLGTPVVLLSTVNPDGGYNLAPMSSAFWLGWRAILGLSAASHSAANLRRTNEVVLNLPSADLVDAVDRLALTTGSDPVPDRKYERGYRHEADKFTRAGLTPVDSETVGPPRVAECPVAMECVVETVHGVDGADPTATSGILNIEVRVQRVHAHPDVLVPGSRDRIDPDRWRPLIMSFQHFYGLTPQRLQPSRLASISEDLYRGPDIDRARQVVDQAGR